MLPATALKLDAGENGFKISFAQNGVVTFEGITNHMFRYLNLSGDRKVWMKTKMKAAR